MLIVDENVSDECGAVEAEEQTLLQVGLGYFEVTPVGSDTTVVIVPAIGAVGDVPGVRQIDALRLRGVRTRELPTTIEILHPAWRGRGPAGDRQQRNEQKQRGENRSIHARQFTSPRAVRRAWGSWVARSSAGRRILRPR